MPDPKTTDRQPLWMKILVALLFVVGLLHLAYMFTGIYAPYGNFYPAAMALLTVAGFAGLSGVMSAEKWGVWVFGVAIVLMLAVATYSGSLGWGHLLLVLPVLVFFFRLKSMS